MSGRGRLLGLAILALVTIAAPLRMAPALSAAEDGRLEVEYREAARIDSPVAGTLRLYGVSRALVIGIDNYERWPRLSNAVKDAREVAAALERQGFAVTLALDLDADALEEAFESFFIETGSDPDARLFVWYAGHGHTEYRLWIDRCSDGRNEDAADLRRQWQ